MKNQDLLLLLLYVGLIGVGSERREYEEMITRKKRKAKKAALMCCYC